jgi:hypothetical protein
MNLDEIAKGIIKAIYFIAVPVVVVIALARLRLPWWGWVGLFFGGGAIERCYDWSKWRRLLRCGKRGSGMPTCRCPRRLSRRRVSRTARLVPLRRLPIRLAPTCRRAPPLARWTSRRRDRPVCRTRYEEGIQALEKVLNGQRISYRPG